jgi:murein DD-endopeptidase MepM/ murein hydrolase activator NlpD
MPRSPFVRFFVYVAISVVLVVGGYYLFTGKWAANVAREPDHDQHADADFPPPPMSGLQSTVPTGSLDPDPNTLPMPRPEMPQPPAVAPDLSKLPSPNLPPLSAEASNPTPFNPKLVPPIEGLQAKDLHDMFDDARSGHAHHAIDIMRPRGTAVHAVVEGNVAKLFTSKYGGLTVYQFDDSGKYCYYYAHLDRYAPDLKEGMLLRPGTVLGYVGSTGDANVSAPHLHMAIFQMGPEKHWWEGTALNPYPALMKSVTK